MAHELKTIAQSIVANNKGILAADESTGTITKRFDGIGVESTEENRRAYRNLLFTTRGLRGVHRRRDPVRRDDPAERRRRDAVPRAARGEGRRARDQGRHRRAPAGRRPGETVTEGLDGLRGRLAEYYELGARFAKWRAMIFIGTACHRTTLLGANAHALARYAAFCQEAGIVPIVEPEVLMDGDHSLDDCDDATGRTLQALYDALYEHRVDLEGSLLKPNMVIPGKGNADQASAERIAEATLSCFRRHVPPAVPGIVFLSGGQSEVEATVNLNAINQLDGRPWPLSFSYGRALQASALTAWRGSQDAVGAAQAAFVHRARCNAAAAAGEYSAEMEQLVTA